MTTRRQFLRQATATAMAFSAFTALRQGASAQVYALDPVRGIDPLGQLKADPDKILNLPVDFSYRVIATTGERMSDGLIRPGAPDGMAAFADPQDADKVILICNHELDSRGNEVSAFEEGVPVADTVGQAAYERLADGRPVAGGTTNMHYSLSRGTVERQFVSLAGTMRNCAGGATPWGTWLSCEETRDDERSGAARPHGFAFEVPASATGPVTAEPLTAMGRFKREAAAVDPDTGIVYMTEDDGEGLFYRFIPVTPGKLSAGGRLQALAVIGHDGVDTANAADAAMIFAEGETHPVRWIDLDAPEAPEGDLHVRGRAAGAATFVRGEGIDYGKDADGRPVIYFAATSGGAARLGQIWQYRPSAAEGTDGEVSQPGTIALHFESADSSVMEKCDNVIVAPWGDLIVCEDGDGDNYMRGITPEGKIYTLAMNAHPDKSEFCGACFSPDGGTMFVNIQKPGFTLAITGPWERLRSA